MLNIFFEPFIVPAQRDGSPPVYNTALIEMGRGEIAGLAWAVELGEPQVAIRLNGQDEIQFLVDTLGTFKKQLSNSALDWITYDCKYLEALARRSILLDLNNTPAAFYSPKLHRVYSIVDEWNYHGDLPQLCGLFGMHAAATGLVDPDILYGDWIKSMGEHHLVSTLDTRVRCARELWRRISNPPLWGAVKRWGYMVDAQGKIA